MKYKLLRFTIGVLEVFIALSAISGGILLLAGSYRNGILIEAGGQGQFPLQWLHNTLFSDYTVPALILMIGVGGSSLIAALLIFIDHEVGALASIVAGLIVVGYIVGEIMILKQGVSWIEGFYSGLGLLISGLSTYLWIAEDLHHHFQTQTDVRRKKGHVHG